MSTTSPTTELSSIVVCSANESRLHLPVKIDTRREHVETQALLDSGAEGSFIHQRFVQKHNLPTLRTAPIVPRNVDGSINLDGVMNQKTMLQFHVGDQTMTETFLVTNIGVHDIILGDPWLKKWNPMIDWQQRTLTLPEELVIDELTTDGLPLQELRIKLHSGEAKIPIKATTDAAGYDLYSAEATNVPAHGSVLVNTQISMAIPAGYYGRIAPRSGLAAKHMIDVGAGVIDADYRGIVKVLLFNLSNTDFPIATGDRIAQLILTAIGSPTILEVDDLDSTGRNEGGFGSTGVASVDTEISALTHVNPATRLAQEHAKTDSRTLEEQIPEWLRDLTHVFQPERATRFPPSRPYDHRIQLKEDC